MLDIITGEVLCTYCQNEHEVSFGLCGNRISELVWKCTKCGALNVTTIVVKSE